MFMRVGKIILFYNIKLNTINIYLIMFKTFENFNCWTMLFHLLFSLEKAKQYDYAFFLYYDSYTTVTITFFIYDRFRNLLYANMCFTLYNVLHLSFI